MVSCKGGVALNIKGAKSCLGKKISGSMFWLLFLFSYALTMPYIADIEDRERERQKLHVDAVLFYLENNLLKNNTLDSKKTLNELQRYIASTSIYHIRVDGVEVAGVHSNDRANYVKYTHKHNEMATSAKPSHTAEVYAVSPKSVAVDKRRNILLAVGLMVIFISGALRYVISIIVTKPFSSIIQTAKQLIGGDVGARFNEKGDDEFAYLCKFINQSLDHIGKKQNEINVVSNKLKDSEAELNREKEIAEVTMHSIGDAVVTTSEQGVIEFVNPMAETILGVPAGAVIGKRVEDVLKLSGVNGCENIHECISSKTKNTPITISIDRPEGRTIDVSVTTAPIGSSENGNIGYIIVFQDITPTRKLAKQLAYQASHDALTGLYNRREFEAHTVAALEDAKKNATEHAVCFIDLDQFKVINDTCGHAAGDQLLRQMSVLLQEHVRDTDILARLGGDELGLLLTFCTVEKAKEISENLLSIINNFRFAWENHVFTVGASIGISVIASDSHTIEEILSSADVACYAAKEGGRNRVHIYHKDDAELEMRKGEMEWVTRIARALDENKFQLHLQPIQAISEAKSCRLKFEVLLRMKEENGKLISPGEFIGAAERFGLMTSIDRWVVKNAIEYASNCSEILSSINCMLSINLSGQSLGDYALLEYIVSELKSNKVPAERICFEITETAAIANLSRADEFISQLKSIGCMFSLDDFGSGLSSFGYLKNLKVDYLKIDGSFVKDMHNDDIDRAMVRAINEIGQIMGIQTIAEFVENAEIYKELSDLGVDYAQGYYISKPLPIDECLEKYCKRRGIEQ